MKESDFQKLLQGLREAGSFLRGNKRTASSVKRGDPESVTPAARAKLRKKWRFAPDASGMVAGQNNLSRRKGLRALSR